MGRPEEYAKLAVAIVENPDAERLVHPPRRRHPLRPQVVAGPESELAGSPRAPGRRHRARGPWRAGARRTDGHRARRARDRSRSSASPSREPATRGATSPRTCRARPRGPRPPGTPSAGWVFVSVDHLGVGDSSQHDSERLTYTPVVAASHAAEAEVLQKLAAGTLIDGLPKVERPVTIGIGQSMGGSLTVVQQGRYHGYDGIGVLGYSAVHTHPPTAPGTAQLVMAWLPRDAMPSDGVFTNGPALAELDPARGSRHGGHGLGLPLRRRRPRRGPARPRGLPGSPGRRPAVGLGHRAHDHRGCGASPRAACRPRRRPSAVPSWWPSASATCWWIRGVSRGRTSRPRAWTSSSAREWDTCTTSPARESCSGGASRRGRTGCGPGGTRADGLMR